MTSPDNLQAYDTRLQYDTAPLSMVQPNWLIPAAELWLQNGSIELPLLERGMDDIIYYSVNGCPHDASLLAM